MPERHDPRDRRFRRSLTGRALPRLRPTPAMLRPAASTAPLTRLLALLLLGISATVLLVGLGGVTVAYGAYRDLADSLTPRLERLGSGDDFQTTRLFDRNGVLLYEFFGTGKRTRVSLSAIATPVISGTIAIEDQSFFENPGVDYLGIARTLLASLSAGEETGGASTITQQLIKTLILDDEERKYENRYQRKITEIILAQELSDRYEKPEILELYLNEIYYGNLAYGIEAAANVYFDRNAAELDLAQSALLAGLPQLPSVYDPINHLQDGVLPGVVLSNGWLTGGDELPSGISPPKWRQIAVLRQMVDQAFISEQQARSAAAQDLVFASQDVPINAPHFVFHVRRLLEEQYGPEFAYAGLNVTTSIDLQLQRDVQRIAAERIGELEARNIHNAAVVVMQPNTGQILAMVGSIDYNRSVPTTTPGETGNVIDGQVNVATRLRQPGSALKPFTYLSALEQGATPATIFWDVPTRFPSVGEWYEPKNYNGRWNGPVRMRAALANSLNMPAVKALKFAGIENTLDLLERLGIKSLTSGESYYGLALTLGGGEVTPLELTTAYNTLASGGRYYPPAAILSVVTNAGETLWRFTPPQAPLVVDPALVAIITDMMSDDQARRPIWGLGSKLNLSRPAAVKTGTSNDWRDAWAAGFTTHATVGVWTGNNNNEPTARVESLTGGGIIWHNVMELMFAEPRYQALLAEPWPRGMVPRDFPMPSFVRERPVCPIAGPFGGPTRELFSDTMLRASSVLTVTAQPGTMPAADGCPPYEVIPALLLTAQPIRGSILTDPASLAGQVCVPPDPALLPAERTVSLLNWRLPPADPAERVVYSWESLNAWVPGGISIAIPRSRLPVCDPATVVEATPAPPPPAPDAIRMPDLQRFGENQAREQLAALGITSIFVDYQTRERIPDAYDAFAPYAVVSTLPAAGDWVVPADTVVLGVRAPDP